MNNNTDPNVKQQSDYIWQDREIRFDSKVNLLACRKGEKIIGSSYNYSLCGIRIRNSYVIMIIIITFNINRIIKFCLDSINSVEDTKGNNGERGNLCYIINR